LSWALAERHGAACDARGLPSLSFPQAYIDTRKCGTQKHAGFGVGFERLVLYATSMDNIRDVIPFPRWHQSVTF